MKPGDVGSLLGHSKLPHAKAPKAPTTLNVAMSNYDAWRLESTQLRNTVTFDDISYIMLQSNDRI